METLAERIARDGPVSELDAIGWAIRLAKRLEALHVLGVAHGSVSPACVIAAGQDRNARAFLADVQHTSPSPPYQSPERILGGDISAADDVWALAATLYALLTGTSPFSAGTDAELRQKILAASPPPLAVYDVGDDDLQHILDHAFARELNGRTASISAFRRALEEWHPDRGVANLPPLDDDEPSDDDDGGRTMLVRDPGGFLRQAIADSIPKVNAADDDDDDEDDVRTVMRSLPQGDLAAIVARATAAADANRAAAPPVPMVSVPRPQAPQPPAPVLPQIADEDSEDMRTVMRTSDQIGDEEPLLHPNGHSPARPLGGHAQAGGPPYAPWTPHQAAPAELAPGASPVAHWGQVRATAATLALPVEEGYPEPYLSGPQGTQKIPPGFMMGPAPGPSAAQFAPAQAGPPQPAYGGGFPPQPMALQPAPAPGPSALALPSAGAGSLGATGKTSGLPKLLLLAVLAVLVAAAATFAFLKLKGL